MMGAATAAAASVAEPEWVTRAADEHGWKWVRINWQRACAQPGFWYDERKADGAVARFPKYFKLTILHFAGVPFIPSFWQECIIRLLFGCKIPAEIIDPRTHRKSRRWVRLFRELRLWVPRKAGKTEFLAALALLVWYYEGLIGGEGYCFARDEKQAAQVFGRMSAMIGSSDPLSAELRVYTDKIWCQSLLAPFFRITSKAEGKHGRVPYVTVGDEMHEWKSRDLADNLRQGEGPHLQPLRLYASTAGLTSQTVGREMFDESVKILEGSLDDPTILVAMFAADVDEDWKDEKLWAKVNPNLGLSPTIAFMRQEFTKALANRAAEAKFRCYHLNQWVDEVQAWIRIPEWDACVGEKDGWLSWFESVEEGRDCVVSFDATETHDFASVCIRFPPIYAGEKTKYLWKFMLPEQTILERGQRENRTAEYQRWVDSGALISIPGGVFELRYAIKVVREAMARWNVLRIGYDPWNATAFYTELVNPTTDDRPIPEDLFVKMRFGHQSLGEATRRFETAIGAGTMHHGGNPVMRMMVKHCHVRFDENMNIVPAKKKSRNAIDGVVAAVMAEALAAASAEGPSVYETRGLVEIDI